MAQVRLCDRCGADAPAGDVATTTRSIVIPSTLPGTNAPKADLEVSFGLQVHAPIDLCEVCQVSALVEYALVRLPRALTPERLAVLSARIVAVAAAKTKAAKG